MSNCTQLRNNKGLLLRCLYYCECLCFYERNWL